MRGLKDVTMPPVKTYLCSTLRQLSSAKVFGDPAPAGELTSSATMEAETRQAMSAGGPRQGPSSEAAESKSKGEGSTRSAGSGSRQRGKRGQRQLDCDLLFTI